MNTFKNLPKSVRTLVLLFIVLVTASFLGLKAFAGGSRVVITQLSNAPAGQSMQIKVQVYKMFAYPQPSVGEKVQLNVKNAIPGQVCDSPQTVTDGNGQIFANCWSPVDGQMFVYTSFPNTPEDETMYQDFPYLVVFGSLPSPMPSVTGVKLVPSPTQLTIVKKFPQISGSLDMILKDAVTDQVITNQTGITYQWSTSDRGVVSIAEEKICVSGIVAPCPNLRANLRGLKPGSATITAKALKNGKVQAITSVVVQVQ